MRFFSIIACCSLLWVSCENNGTEEPASPAPPAEGEPATGWPATKMTEGGTYSVTVTPTKGEITENEHFSLNVSLAAKVLSTKGLTVKVDADMPAHGHGMNTAPELTAEDELKYRADGMLFHMAGEWVIFVDVTNNGRTERASFPVLVE